MVERKAGGILISGSAAGNSPIPNNATYAATKAFVNTFSESLRGELKRDGVHVTLLAPGPVRETLPDPTRAVAGGEADPGLPVDLHRVHRQAVAGWPWSATRCAIVPGVTSKAMSVAAGYAPRAIVTPIVGAVYKKLGGD